jgi:hypothetical protein
MVGVERHNKPHKHPNLERSWSYISLSACLIAYLSSCPLRTKYVPTYIRMHDGTDQLGRVLKYECISR